MMTRSDHEETQLPEGDSGAAWAEWIVVTVILIAASYALFQAVGVELGASLSDALERLKSILGGIMTLPKSGR